MVRVVERWAPSLKMPPTFLILLRRLRPAPSGEHSPHLATAHNSRQILMRPTASSIVPLIVRPHQLPKTGTGTATAQWPPPALELRPAPRTVTARLRLPASPRPPQR